MGTMAAIVDSVVDTFTSHDGVEVGEMKEGAGEGDGYGAGGVEAEEIDAGDATGGDVGADIEFGETGEAVDGRQAARMDVAHAEGDDAEPGFTVEGVEGEQVGDEGAQGGGFDRPMREEEFMPALGHDPASRGQGLLQVSGGVQDGGSVHVNLL